jgi:hypothetical protein
MPEKVYQDTCNSGFYQAEVACTFQHVITTWDPSIQGIITPRKLPDVEDQKKEKQVLVCLATYDRIVLG